MAATDGSTAGAAHSERELDAGRAHDHRRELMASHFWWYVARASGLVAWALVVASCMWGLLHAMHRSADVSTPTWMLSVHRYLAALAIVFTGVHVVALVADSFVHFDLADVLVPTGGELAPARGRVGHRRHVPARHDRGDVAAPSHLSTRVWRGSICSATCSLPSSPSTC